MMTSEYLPFDPLVEPKHKLPAGTVDCHFHVFEDPKLYPYTADRSYTPSLAPWAAFEAMNQAIGADRAVLVHPSVYGHDHSTLYDTMHAHAERLRAVAVLSVDSTDAEIERLHLAGTRGTRVNILFAGGSQLSDAETLARRIQPFGWHIQFLVDVAAKPDIPMWAAKLGVPVVFDHFGHPSKPSVDDAGFRNMCALVKEGTAWVKLSGAYRVVDPANQWAAIQPFVDALLNTRTDRLVWGTDWPHPNIPAPMPNDGDIADTVFQWLPSEALRQQILVKNPEQLYDFAPFVNR
ncbi:amidohydrolase family protein [Zwartia sp.]|uniref:amidohydrolase family protein n=1 Tax=Zwartia sp. TaxID=2978004 RepID=UPI002717A609|nr:amidohydrolase family protein [Zwartia sp.]MDO9024893.1 amidohydrolase family protein [Zwartia sp.]